MARFTMTNGQPARAVSYVEAARLDGFAFAHIAARDEADRAAMLADRERRLIRAASREGRS